MNSLDLPRGSSKPLGIYGSCLFPGQGIPRLTKLCLKRDSLEKLHLQPEIEGRKAGRRRRTEIH